VEKGVVSQQVVYGALEQAAMLWACSNSCECEACKLLRKMAKLLVQIASGVGP